MVGKSVARGWTALGPALLLAACGGGPAPTVKTGTSAAPKDSAAAAAAAAHAPRPRRASFDTLAAAGQRPLMRETYQYQGAGRDPFKPVVIVAEGGPELPDLKLVGVIYDHTDPEKSVATFRETGSNRPPYSLRLGDRIGRISVVSISATDVTLREDDFGVERRQNYSLRKPEDGKP